jgi:hypothetical protein
MTVFPGSGLGISGCQPPLLNSFVSIIKSTQATMRVIAEIPHPAVKITLFHWNGKYLIKLERGNLEQTYKVSELDVTGEQEVRAMLDESFISAVVELFDQMRGKLREARERAES